MLLLYKEDDGWIWSEGCNILVDPHLITFWLSLSSTELERSKPLCSVSPAVRALMCSMLAAEVLGSNCSLNSALLEKSIGELVSSSNIPKDTKTEKI